LYNHAPLDYVCPFCALVANMEHEHLLSRRDDIVLSRGSVTAFIGLRQWPNNPGGVIVIPNEHFENIYDLPAHLAVEIHAVAQAIAIAMKAAFGCDGVSTRQHNEPAGNQDVWHYHLHVTPRYTGDNFYGTRGENMPAPQRAELAQRLTAHLMNCKPMPQKPPIRDRR